MANKEKDNNKPSFPTGGGAGTAKLRFEPTTFEEGAIPDDFYEQTFANFEEGQVVQGVIVEVKENEVIVDVGLKSEGSISIEQFRRELAQGVQIQPGDVVDVFIERTEDSEGKVVLSKDKADRIKIWKEIEEAFKNGERVIGRVVDKIKGGLQVDIGVKAFLPGSQTGLRNISQIDSLVGKEIEARIIKLNPQRKNIVLSRKAVLEEDAEIRKAELMESLREGNRVKGFVKNITEYGAFIDLGGIDGLLHITDMSWGRINHPSEMFNIGDEVDVVVLKFDEEKQRVSLGYKQKFDDPWKSVPNEFPVSTRVAGKVISIADYGAFVELKEGVEGLIHVSEMSWSKRLRHPSKIVNVGDTVDAIVLDLDVTNKRISLGMKQIEQNPWDLVHEKFPIGSRVKGVVRNITNFGAFVEIDEGIDGLIHISDLSWTQRVKHPNEVLKKGDEVEAVVLAIDKENERISLGLKQTEENPWESIAEKYPIGSEIEGKVLRITDYGAFVEIEDGIEGLLPISELEKIKEYAPDDEVAPDTVRKMRVKRVDPAERQITLTMAGELNADLDKYLRENTGEETTLGSAFMADPTTLSKLYEMTSSKAAKKAKEVVTQVAEAVESAVESAAEAIEEAVESVKEAVVETLEKVEEAAEKKPKKATKKAKAEEKTEEPTEE